MKSFRPDIEGLRALSITLVVAYHYCGTWLPGGYIGVDVFFVISGYLITHSLVDLQGTGQTLRQSLFTFWARRARRLLPNALLLLLAVSLVGALWLSDVALSRLGNDVKWAAAYSINWLYVLRAVDYLRWGESDASVLLNYWSLAVEEQFYLLWPLLLLTVWRRTPGGCERALRGAALLAAGLAAVSLGYALWLSQSRLTPAFFSSPARAWELLTGAALALQSRRAGGWPRVLRAGAAWAGLAAVMAAAVLMAPDSQHPGWITLLPVLGSVLLLGSLGNLDSDGALPLREWLGSAPLRALGARSYSIYLWHWPVLVLGTAWLPRGAAWGPALLLGVSLLLAELAFRAVESPARWRWGGGLPAGRVLLLALTGSTLVALAGLALHEIAERSARSGALSTLSRGVAGLPPLRQLQADLPVVYANGCHLGVPQQAPAEGCRLSGTADVPAVLLFGDSHAAQWVPALQPVAAAHGQALLVWTKSGCPSADITVWIAAAGGIYRECDAWREAVFGRLAALRPALVVVSNLIDDDTVVVDRASGQKLRGAAASVAFEAGLVRTLRRLHDAGVPVVLMRDNPRPRKDVLDCLYASADPALCARKRSDALPGDALDLRAARAAAVPVWDLGESICGPQSCPVVTSTGSPPRVHVVYRDDNHLSASFAGTLAPALARQWALQPVQAR